MSAVDWSVGAGGMVTGFAYHDGKLLKFCHDSVARQLALRLRNLQDETIDIVFDSVFRVSATGYLEAQIANTFWLWNAGALLPADQAMPQSVAWKNVDATSPFCAEA